MNIKEKSQIQTLKQAKQPETKIFNVYALSDLLDWNGNLVCEHGDKVSISLMNLDNGFYSVTIKGNHNSFFFTKATKEEISKLVSARNPEPPAGYYIGDVFYY